MFSFKDIFGQDRAIDSIRRAYLADRLPHGLIFAGPVGVGKATTARALGQLFLCTSPSDDVPCGGCSACTVYQAGNHPDYHVITKELIRFHDKTGKSKGVDLSIHVLRPELIEPASRKSTLNRGKVFIIEQAELMNPQAQNAILKTLEEPAGRTLIILLTDDAMSLLPTIRSRCQMVRFATLDTALVRQELEKRNCAPDDAAYAAAMSEGSLGLALRWIDDGVVVHARDLVTRLNAILSGRVSLDLAEWFKKAADDYAARQLEREPLSSKDQATREGLSLYLRLASQALRRRLKETQDPDALERLCAAIEAIAQANTALAGNVNISLVFQQLIVRLERLFTHYVHH